MMGLRDFYCIRVNTRYLNEVINAHEALEKKGFIEFSSAGMFSASIDVVYENYFFEQELRKAGIPFSVRKVRSRYCLDPVMDFKEALGYTANHKTYENDNLACDFVTKEELNSAIASLHTGNCDEIRQEVMDVLESLFDDSDENQNKGTNGNTEFIKASDVRNIKLQRTKITERQLLNFKLEKRRTKWELIKALQEEFDKLPDETEFNSFSAIGIGIGRSRYL